MKERESGCLVFHMEEVRSGRTVKNRAEKKDSQAAQALITRQIGEMEEHYVDRSMLIPPDIK